MKKSISNFLLGFLAGVAAGAVAGILFAPDKGNTTRQNIKKKVRDLSDEFGLGLNELINEFGLEPEPESKSGGRKQAAKTPKPPSVKKRKYSPKPKLTTD